MTEGFAIMPNWMTRDPNVTPNMRAVYVCLAGHTGKHGTWEIRQNQIADECGLSVRTVQRTLSALRDLGVLDWQVDSDQQREGRGAEYRLTYPPRHPSRTPPVTGDVPPTTPVTYQEKNPKKNPKKDDSLRSSSARGARLPDPFIVSAELLAWADARLIPRGFVMEQTERFVDYWRAATGSRAVKADWAATWRNWIRRAWDEGGARWQRTRSVDNPENW